MNRIFTPPHRAPTQTADGLPRWRWTVAEIERMAAEGYFRDDERLELLGGRSCRCRRRDAATRPSAKRLRFASRALRRRELRSCESQFDLSPDTYLVPDVLVRPASVKTPDLRGPDALLVVEIADTSLSYDLTTKASLYASHGVREYWVINAVTLVTKVHRQPSGDRYASTAEIGPSNRLAAFLIPSLSLSLDTIAVD